MHTRILTIVSHFFIFQVFAVIIAAYRAELFSAAISLRYDKGGDRELPLGICFFLDEDNDVYGDRICNNAIACAIVSILVAMALMIVDLQIPCTNAMVCDLYINLLYKYSTTN